MNKNLYHAYISEGKKTYYVNGEKFYNTNKGSRDGYEKAMRYCLDNFINTQDIIQFDSMLECKRYEYLLLLQENGKISKLQYHFILKLQDEFTNANGDVVPAITYNADFIYHDNEKNVFVVEDVKGASLLLDTRFMVLKQLFDFKFLAKNVYLKVIVERSGQWVEWKIGDTKKPQKLIKKQQEKLREQKQLLHEQEVKNKKIERLKKRYDELMNKQDKTTQEKKRLVVVVASLKDLGVIID